MELRSLEASPAAGQVEIGRFTKVVSAKVRQAVMLTRRSRK